MREGLAGIRFPPEAEECRERQSLALEEFRNLDLQAGCVRLEHVVEEERAKIIPLFHGTNPKKLQKWSPQLDSDEDQSSARLFLRRPAWGLPPGPCDESENQARCVSWRCCSV